MPLLLLLLIAGVAELSVLILVGKVIGVLPTIGLLVAGAVLGSWLLRREGRRTLHEISEAARLRRPPTREFADGALIAVGGIMIILPGFLSDISGLLFLLPPTRALLRRWIERSAERRSRMAQDQARRHMWTAQTYVRYPGETATRGRGGSEDVVDGEVVSVSEDEEHGGEQELPPRNQPPPESYGR